MVKEKIICLCIWHIEKRVHMAYEKKKKKKKTYMPYLTLWDKISQNLAHLEGNAHKKPISQNLQTILQQILWRNKYKSNTIVVITRFLHEKKINK